MEMGVYAPHTGCTNSVWFTRRKSKIMCAHSAHRTTPFTLSFAFSRIMTILNIGIVCTCAAAVVVSFFLFLFYFCSTWIYSIHIHIQHDLQGIGHRVLLLLFGCYLMSTFLHDRLLGMCVCVRAVWWSLTSCNTQIEIVLVLYKCYLYRIAHSSQWMKLTFSLPFHKHLQICFSLCVFIYFEFLTHY